MTPASRTINARKVRGWSQEDLASRCGYSRRTITAIETGETEDPRGSTLNKIAKAFGFSDWEDLARSQDRGETLDQINPETVRAYTDACDDISLNPAQLMERFMGWVASNPSKPFEIIPLSADQAEAREILDAAEDAASEAPE